MKGRTGFSIIASFILVLCGCSTFNRYLVTVDSITARNPGTGYRYRLVPAMEGIDESDLFFQEYAEYIDKVLLAKGYRKAGNDEAPEVLIYVSYGIGNPEIHEKTRTEPVWGQTGVEPKTIQETTENPDGTKTQTERTEYTPTYGVVGYTTETESFTTYTKYVVLNAIDNGESGNGSRTIQLWKTIITTKGVSDDLRKLFPVMIAAAFDYIGTDTGEKIEIEINENDDRITAIRE